MPCNVHQIKASKNMASDPDLQNAIAVGLVMQWLWSTVPVSWQGAFGEPAEYLNYGMSAFCSDAHASCSARVLACAPVSIFSLR